MFKIFMLLVGLTMINTITANAKVDDNPFLIHGKCPNAQNIMEISSEQTKHELINAINDLVPKIYNENDKYTEWTILNITPLSEVTYKPYYDLGVNFCGKDLANKSWFIEILFPKFLPAYDASHGQIFIAKSKENEWIAWFKFH